MKQYPHIFSKLFYEPLIITRARHHAICQVVESHMARVEAAEDEGADTEPLPPEYTRVGKTAIIPVHGVLTRHARDIPMSACGCGLDTLLNLLTVAESDDAVRRVVFDFDTPGGGVTGIPEAARRIANCPKETIAYTESECCSGGMWLASQCQRFYASESATVGSIGVWCAYLDLSAQMAMEGERIQAFSAGKFKTMGAYWKPLSDEERKMIQGSVDKIYGQFKAAITSRREVADEFMQGQTFDAAEAIQAGLVDGLVEDIGELVEDEDDEDEEPD